MALKNIALLIFIIVYSSITFGQTLEKEFKNPPASSKPRTWMHAMSGNMSKVGMTKDLEAISAAGQGGILLFNIANQIPYGDVPYGSDEHHQVLTHAAKECERLGLSFGVHNCDGWTSSAGPWIKPEESMKMVVHTETVIDGGREISIPLVQPSTLEGFYKDIAVIAYPALKSEIDDAAFNPTITASDKDFNIAIIKNKGKVGTSKLDKTEDKNPWIVFDYGTEKEISSIYLSYLGTQVKVTLETSADGKNFTPVKTFNRYDRLGKLQWIISDQFNAVKAQFFRLSFDRELDVIELKLSSTKPYRDFTKFTGFSEPNNYLDIEKNPGTNILIDKTSIINLTSSLSADGTLKTKLPKGKWTVMRFGFTSTGAQNWPASKWGTGLECDKFSRAAMKKHFDAFSQKVIDNAKKEAPNALQYIEIDSYEMGGQNWTDGFEAIFKKEKGYDIIPFLPVFAGRFVESPEAVAGVTYDLNDLFTSLMTNNYFKYFTELCNKNGLKSYIEPYGGGPVSTLDVSEYIDLPMTEFWMGRENQKYLTGTIHGAHIYGKSIISAEAFTALPDLNWNNHPGLAKTWGDMAWVSGVNEFMFHRFVHQANTHVKPGLTMGKWGSNFDRTQTWWMNAGVEWFNYIARGSHLLRQGYHAADVLVFVGDLPHKEGFKRSNLKYQLPLGINYDCTSAQVLINRFSIKDKTLVLPEGGTYTHLMLNDTPLITLSTLKRIKEIVDAGIPVIGKKPMKLAGYNVSAQHKAEFDMLTKHIWSSPNCFTTFDFNKLQADFAVEGQEVPFIHRKTADKDIYFFYNKDEKSVRYESVFRVDNKIPELWNPTTGETVQLANFKSEANQTRVWIDLKPLESAFIVFEKTANNVKSVVSTDADKQFYLKPNNTVVVETFSEKPSSISWSNGKTTTIEAANFPEVMDLSTDWGVEFLKEHEYAAITSFPKLTDWKDNEKDEIKYYSGTAIYTKSFKMGKAKEGLRYILDLGSVDIVAEVIVNGKKAGVLWMAPFELDITDFLLNGNNKLEIKITNQWSNRLIGDENYPKQDGGYKVSGYIPDENSKMPDWYVKNQPMPNGPRSTFSSFGFYKKGDKLSPSGLKGPVKIKYKRVIEIK